MCLCGIQISQSGLVRTHIRRRPPSCMMVTAMIVTVSPQWNIPDIVPYHICNGWSFIIHFNYQNWTFASLWQPAVSQSMIWNHTFKYIFIEHLVVWLAFRLHKMVTAMGMEVKYWPECWFRNRFLIPGSIISLKFRSVNWIGFYVLPSRSV